MLTLTIVWSYIKKYWQYAVAIGLFAVGFFLFNHRTDLLSEALDAARKRHDDELKEIKAAHEKELADKEVALKKVQDTLVLVEKHYQEAQKELDDKKRKEVRKIVEETKDDPQELARRLQESTGFKIDVAG